MMNGLRHITFLICWISAVSFGQDVLFSQTENSHLNLNPALCGFENDLSINSNYKTQWKPTLAPFKTFAFSADANLNGKSKSPWNFSIGTMIYHDQAGDPQLNTLAINGYFASKIKLSENQNLGAGLFVGYRQLSLQSADGQWASQFNGLNYDPEMLSGETFDQMSFGKLNSGIGLAYHIGSGKRSRIENNEKFMDAGFAVYNLNKPQNTFFTDSKERLKQRYSAFVKGHISVRGSITSFQPAVYYHRQGTFQEIQYGTYFSVNLLKSGNYIGTMADYKVGLGLFHRLGDALIAKIYANVGDFRFGMSYDFNISSLQLSSNLRGGTEFYLGYQLKSFRK